MDRITVFCFECEKSLRQQVFLYNPLKKIVRFVGSIFIINLKIDFTAGTPAFFNFPNIIINNKVIDTPFAWAIIPNLSQSSSKHLKLIFLSPRFAA